jgi:hypothetical protein
LMMKIFYMGPVQPVWPSKTLRWQRAIVSDILISRIWTEKHSELDHSHTSNVKLNPTAKGHRMEFVNVEVWSLTPCLSVQDAQQMENRHLFLKRHATF